MKPRTALVASADRSFRQRLTHVLCGLRWQVREAEGGAQAWAEAEAAVPEAMILDAWLPDLELNEFVRDFRGSFPGVDLVTAAGSGAEDGSRGPHRQELLYALRQSQEVDTAAWDATPASAPTCASPASPKEGLRSEFRSPAAAITAPKEALSLLRTEADMPAVSIQVSRSAPTGRSRLLIRMDRSRMWVNWRSAM